MTDPPNDRTGRDVHEARRLVRQFWNYAKLCYCGNPEKIIPVIHGALLAHGEPGPKFDGGPARQFYDEPLSLFVLYMLDAWQLTEHGGSLIGAWLTPSGIRLRDALRQVDPETVLDEDWHDTELELYPAGRPGRDPHAVHEGEWDDGVPPAI